MNDQDEGHDEFFAAVRQPDDVDLPGGDNNEARAWVPGFEKHFDLADPTDASVGRESGELGRGQGREDMLGTGTSGQHWTILPGAVIFGTHPIGSAAQSLRTGGYSRA